LESKKTLARQRRHERIRKKISGTELRPRLCVYKSNKHIYAQVSDDTKGTILVSASTIDKEVKGSIKAGCNILNAKQIGTLVAKRAIVKGIESVVFDRGGYIYHGRIKALADAAREEGLKF
jgi:large subunit ribosomal protein L18